MGYFPPPPPPWQLLGSDSLKLCGCNSFYPSRWVSSQPLITLLKYQSHPCSRPAGNPCPVLQDAQTCLPGTQLIAHCPELKHQQGRSSVRFISLLSSRLWTALPKAAERHAAQQGTEISRTKFCPPLSQALPAARAHLRERDGGRAVRGSVSAEPSAPVEAESAPAPRGSAHPHVCAWVIGNVMQLEARSRKISFGYTPPS